MRTPDAVRSTCQERRSIGMGGETGSWEIRGFSTTYDDDDKYDDDDSFINTLIHEWDTW